MQLVAQLPWTHNIILIERIEDKEICKWYVEECVGNGWSKSVLIYQIDTDLYTRQVKIFKFNFKEKW